MLRKPMFRSMRSRTCLAPPQLDRQPVELRLLRAPLQRLGNMRQQINGSRARERLDRSGGQRVPPVPRTRSSRRKEALFDHLPCRVMQLEDE